MYQTKKRNFIKKNTFGRQYNNRSCHNFLSTARRMGRSGNYGRGTHIEEEHFQYFFIILEELQNPAESFEERVSMATNVLEETKGQEIHLASNQLVSKVIEALLGFAGEDHFERFIDVFGENFRPICSDPFASHVIQKMVEIAFLRALAEHKIENGDKPKEVPWKKNRITYQHFNMETKFSKHHQEKCAAFVERISKFLLNNLEDFVSDNYGIFVIQACVYYLAGIHIPKVVVSLERNVGKNKPVTLDKADVFETPETWHEILKEFPSRLQMWPQLADLVYKDGSSALLVAICSALGKVEKNTLKHFGKKLIKGPFFDTDAAKRENEIPVNGLDNDQNCKKGENDTGEEKSDKIVDDALPPVFSKYASVRLLQCLINTAGPKLYNDIYKTFFEGRFVELVMNRLGLLACKVMLTQMKDKTLFETIFDQLVEQFDRFMDHPTITILPEISSACLRLNTKQAAFITALQCSLHCSTAHGTDRPNSFLTCLLKLKRFEELGNGDYMCTETGSRVAANILHFKKPIFLVNCILDSYPGDIFNIIISLYGSFVANAFLESKFIGEKSRDKLLKILDGLYMDLALSQFGSRVLENMFHVANETQKSRIAKELTSRDNKLKGAIYGRILYHKFRLKTFRLSPEQWKSSWNVKDLKKDELNDIVKKKMKRTTSTPDENCESKKKK